CSECANCITSKSDPRVIKGKKQYYCTLKEKGVNDSAGNKCADYVSASLMSGGVTFTESPDQAEVHEPAPYSAPSPTPYAPPPTAPSSPKVPRQGLFSLKRDCAFCRNCIHNTNDNRHNKNGKAYWCSYYEKGVNSEDSKNCSKYSTLSYSSEMNSEILPNLHPLMRKVLIGVVMLVIAILFAIIRVLTEIG
ncbi:MAG: hypothetical protein LBS74_07100, partial [Oscillospiraceae bacterium]|nr:hypothetical protein [Oscillospiraceae bacterium]